MAVRNDQVTVDILLRLKGINDLNTLNRTLLQFRSTMGRVSSGGGPIQDTVRGLRQFQAATVQSTKSVGSFTRGLASLERQMDPIFRAGFRMQMVGNDLYNFGRNVASALGDIMSQFGDFEFMLNRAAGAMGILEGQQVPVTQGASEMVDIYGDLKRQVLDTADSLALFPAEEVAKATYFWASTTGQAIKTQQDLETAMRGVEPIMKVAAMTQTEYETAIKGTYSVIAQYSKSLDDVAEVTAVLHRVTQATAAEFPDLINSFKMVGPLAASVDESFEEVAETFGKLADVGIRGTMAGRAYRQFLIQTIRPAEKARNALEDLFDLPYEQIITDAQGTFIGLEGFIQRLTSTTINMTDVQRQAILASISTANELPLLTAMVSKQREEVLGLGEGWEEAKYSIDGAAVGFYNAWRILRESWNATVAEFMRGLDRIRITVADVFAEELTPHIKDFSAVLRDVLEFVENNRSLVVLAGTLTVVGTGLTLLSGLALRFIGHWIAMSAALFNAAFVLRNFANQIGKFNFLFGAAGFLGIIAAVARNFDYLRDRLVEAGRIIVKAMGGPESAVASLGDALGNLFSIAAPVFDFIVRSAADMIVVFAKLAAAILTNRPAVELLQTLAKVLVVVFAISRVASILAMAKAVIVASRAFAALKMVVVAASVYQFGAAAAGAVVGVSSLRAAVHALYLSIGGLPAVIAAAVIAFLALTPVGKTIVDNIAEAFRDLKGEIVEVEQLFGKYTKAFQREADAYIQAGSAYKELTKLQAEGLPVEMGQARLDYLSRVADLEKQILTDRLNFMESLSNRAEQISQDFEIDLSSDEYLGQIRKLQTAFGLNLDQTEYLLGSWYKRMDKIGDKPLSASGIRELYKELQSMWKASGFGELDFDESRLGRVLAQLKDGAVLPPGSADATLNSYQEFVDELYAGAGDILGGGDPSAMAQNGREAAQGILDAFTTGFADFALTGGYSGWDKKIKELIKTSPTAVEMSDAIYHVMRPDSDHIIKALRSDLPAVRAAGMLWLEDSVTQFNAAWAAGTPAQQEKMKAQWSKLLAAGVPEGLPPEMTIALDSIRTLMFGEISKPPNPKQLADVRHHGGAAATALTTVGADFTKQVAQGVTDTAPVVGDAVSDLGAAALEGAQSIDLTQFFTWGANTAQAYINGVRSKVGAAVAVGTEIANATARSLRAYSPPKYGPLKDIDIWGKKTGEAYASGLRSSRGAVLRSALELAGAASAANQELDTMASSGFDVKGSNVRTVKLEVDVRSRDGSVDPRALKDIRKAIVRSVNDELGHMVTVG